VRLPSSRPTAPGHGWDSIAFSDEALHDMAVSQDTMGGSISPRMSVYIGKSHRGVNRAT